MFEQNCIKKITQGYKKGTSVIDKTKVGQMFKEFMKEKKESKKI